MVLPKSHLSYHRSPLSPGARPGAFPFRVANLAAFLEYLLHQVVTGKSSAGAAPILESTIVRVIGQQSTNLFLQSCHSFFKCPSGHDRTPAMKVAAFPFIVAVRNRSGKTSPAGCTTANVKIMKFFLPNA